MPIISNINAKGIIKWSNDADAKKISLCNKEVRKYYEIDRRKPVNGIQIWQHNIAGDEFIVRIKTNLLPWYYQEHLLNINDLKQKLDQFHPLSIDFDMADAAVAELLSFLQSNWFDRAKSIEIRCRDSCSKRKSEVASKIKEKIADMLARFEKIDNILFTPNEISTISYEHLQLICCWVCKEKYQKRGLRIKYENLEVTIGDVENIMNNIRLGMDFHLWFDDNTEEKYLENGIRLFLSPLADENGRKIIYKGTSIQLMKHYEHFDTRFKRVVALACLMYMSLITYTLFYDNDGTAMAVVYSVFILPYALLLVAIIYDRTHTW